MNLSALKTEKIPVLVVEDDDIHAEGLLRAFKKENIPNPIYRSHDGIEAYELLCRLPQPCIVLLDISLPRMSGFGLLEKIRRNEKTSETLVFVIATMGSDEDRLRAYDNNVAGYILKKDVENFMPILRGYCTGGALSVTPQPLRA